MTGTFPSGHRSVVDRSDPGRQSCVHPVSGQETKHDEVQRLVKKRDYSLERSAAEVYKDDRVRRARYGPRAVLHLTISSGYFTQDCLLGRTLESLFEFHQLEQNFTLAEYVLLRPFDLFMISNSAVAVSVDTKSFGKDGLCEGNF